MIGYEIVVLAEPIARLFDLHHHGMVEKSVQQCVFALLCGEVLGIGDRDLVAILALGTVSVVAVVTAFRPLLLSSVSPNLCQARGISAARLNLLFFAIVALATAMALPVVGALLVFSLMVGPASAARAFTDRPVLAMTLSGALAVLTVCTAIALSYVPDLPIGFFVGALSAVAYGAGRIRLQAPLLRLQRSAAIGGG